MWVGFGWWKYDGFGIGQEKDIRLKWCAMPRFWLVSVTEGWCDGVMV